MGMNSDNKEKGRNSALHLKLGVAPEPNPALMTPAKALRIAVSKAAEEQLSLAATVLEVKEEKRALEPFLETLAAEEEEGAPLLIVLQGEEGALGVAIPDEQLVAAVIEIQTMGRVLPAQAAPRALTATDAAMCSGFLDRLLTIFSRALSAETEVRWASGYQFARRAENARLLGLMLEDVPYRVFRLSVDLGVGAKQGRLRLVFPVKPAAGKPAKAGGSGKSWHEALEDQVMESHAMVEAILHRMFLTLAELRRLKTGDILQIPLWSVGNVSLESAPKQRLARVRLGQQNGMRAVRLMRPDAVSDGAVTGAAAGAAAACPRTDGPQAAPLTDPLAEPLAAPPVNEVAPAGGLADLPEAPPPDGQAAAAAGLAEPLAEPLSALPETGAEPGPSDETELPQITPMTAMPMDMEIG